MPVNHDGQIDADERRIVGEIGAWMRVNGESIYGTRPWTRFGEGPRSPTQRRCKARASTKAGQAAGRKICASPPGATRSTPSVFGCRPCEVRIESLAGKGPPPVQRIDLLGGAEKLRFRQDAEALTVTLPAGLAPSPAYVLRIV